MDYQPGDLTFTLPITTTNGDQIPVPLEILSDEAVEGDHTFSAAVQDSDLVIPGQATTIEITDNDCEGLLEYLFRHSLERICLTDAETYIPANLLYCLAFSCGSFHGISSVHSQ